MNGRQRLANGVMALLAVFLAGFSGTLLAVGAETAPWGAGGFQVASTDEDSIGPKCLARVVAAYNERGITLKSPQGWGWWLKELKVDTLELGKRRLPSDNGGLFPREPYREILDSLGGTDGYAIIRDTTDPHIVFAFGARDAGTVAATEDFLRNGYTGDKIVRVGAPQIDANRWTNRPHGLVREKYVLPDGPGEVVEFAPNGWALDRNGTGTTFGMKTDERGETYLEIVQTAEATGTCRIKQYVGGKNSIAEAVRIPRYGAAVFEVEADADWRGGSLVFVGPGWKGGGSVSICGNEKPYNSWNWQRTGLIGNFHTGDDQKLALQANPREKVPANARVTLVNSLSRAWYDAAPTHTASIVNFDIPPNDTGRTRTFKFYSIRFIENVTDDRYLAQAKAYDQRLLDYEPDYSDSSAEAEIPETNRLPEPFPVVAGGAAVASIALPAGEISTCLETTATEFNKYVKLITGVELPVVRGEPAGAAIRLGFGTFEKAGGKDGYRISYKDGSIAIDGGNDKGVMNGAFALLENNTDIIWAHPTESCGTVFTESPGALTFLWGDGYEAIPETPGRGLNGYQQVEWLAHNQCNIYNCGGGGDITWMNAKKSQYGVLYTRHMGGHNVFQFMDGAPTDSPVGYYACNEAGERTGGNPCFSSEKLFELYSRNVLSTLRYAPDDTDEIYINLQDTWKSCLCRNCRAPIVFEDGTRVEPTDENFFSTRYFLFMNRLAEEVRREFPAKRITTLAYFGSLPAPACAIHPNLTPEYAPYPRENVRTPLYHPDNRLLMQHLDDWYDLVGPNRLEVYGYHGLSLAFPRPNSETAVEDFKLYNTRTLGISSEYSERTEAIWDYASIEFWTMLRLMWDTNQSVERLRKRYIRRVYHEGAPAMERFFGTIRREYCRRQVREGGTVSLVGGTKDLIVVPGHVNELRACLAEARAATANPRSLAMLDRVSEQFESGVAQVKAAAVKTTDDIQNRLRNASPRDVVTVAPGTYKVSETIYLTNCVSLVSSTGSRDDVVFEPADGFTGRLCVLRAPDTTAANRPVVSGITFRGTESEGRNGGQLLVQYPGGVVTNCRFTGCITRSLSDPAGGAVYLQEGGSLLDSVIDHNKGLQTAGTSNNAKACATAGVLMGESGSAKKNIGGVNVERCLIVHNEGYGIRYANITYYNPLVRHCTIADNGGYKALVAGRESSFRDNILLVSSNRSFFREPSCSGPASRGGNVIASNFYPVAPTFNAGNATFTGNIIGWDPKFANPRAMDYRLCAGSPCIGAASDGGDVGCFAYDPEYVPPMRRLYVAADGNDANGGTDEDAPLATLKRAVAVAEDGTEILVAPGTYPLSETLVIDKPIRLASTGGRDVTFIEPGPDAPAEFVLLETGHYLAEVRGFTIRNGKTTMVRQMKGGVVEDCHLTGYYSTKQKGFANGIVWSADWGVLYRCLVDGNFHNQYCSPTLLYAAGRRDDSCHQARFGLLDTCLVVNNEIWYIGGGGHTRMGAAVTLTRNGTATGELGSMQNCTIASNDLSSAVSVSRFAQSVRNNVILGGVSTQETGDNLTKLKGRFVANCMPEGWGSACVTEPPVFKNPRKGNFIPKAGSSVIGKAKPLLFVKDDFDLNGQSRVRRDGEQDIGCCQWIESGLKVIVR